MTEQSFGQTLNTLRAACAAYDQRVEAIDARIEQRQAQMQRLRRKREKCGRRPYARELVLEPLARAMAEQMPGYTGGVSGPFGLACQFIIRVCPMGQGKAMYVALRYHGDQHGLTLVDESKDTRSYVPIPADADVAWFLSHLVQEG